MARAQYFTDKDVVQTNAQLEKDSRMTISVRNAVTSLSSI